MTVRCISIKLWQIGGFYWCRTLDPELQQKFLPTAPADYYCPYPKIDGSTCPYPFLTIATTFSTCMVCGNMSTG